MTGFTFIGKSLTNLLYHEGTTQCQIGAYWDMLLGQHEYYFDKETHFATEKHAARNAYKLQESHQTF